VLAQRRTGPKKTFANLGNQTAKMAEKRLKQRTKAKAAF